MSNMSWSLYLTSFRPPHFFAEDFKKFSFSCLGCFGSSLSKKSEYDTILSHVLEDERENLSEDESSIRSLRVFVALFESFSNFLFFLKDDDGSSVLLKETSLSIHIESEFVARCFSAPSLEEVLSLTSYLRQTDYDLFQRFLEIRVFLKSFSSVKFLYQSFCLQYFLVDFKKSSSYADVFEVYCYMLCLASFWCEELGLKPSEFFETLGGPEFQDLCYSVFQDFCFLLEGEEQDF